jgi:hypothetical protein
MITRNIKPRHHSDLRAIIADCLGAGALFVLLWAGLHLPLFA